MSARLKTGAQAALAKHRRQLRDRGLQRLEVRVQGGDADLLRAAAAALNDPKSSAKARAALLAGLAPAPARSLKDLLAAAPLDGVELERDRDLGRPVDL